MSFQIRNTAARAAGVLALALLTSILTREAAYAQATAQISGSVRDETGAVVPGVQVTATQTDTGFKRTAESDDSGYYVLTNLPLGPYRLDATKMGFRAYVQTGIALQVGTAPEIAISL